MTKNKRELPTKGARTTLASVKREMDETPLTESVRTVSENETSPVLEEHSAGSANGRDASKLKPFVLVAVALATIPFHGQTHQVSVWPSLNPSRSAMGIINECHAIHLSKGPADGSRQGVVDQITASSCYKLEHLLENRLTYRKVAGGLTDKQIKLWSIVTADSDYFGGKLEDKPTLMPPSRY
jgi:hypothetical protein